MFNWFNRKKLTGKQKVIQSYVDYAKYDTDAGLKTKTTFQGQAVTIRRTPLAYPRTVYPGDGLKLEVTYDDDTPTQIRTFTIEKPLRVDECFVFELDDALGYKHALIGGFGQLGD